MIEVTTSSVEQTRELAEVLSGFIGPGDLLVLVGDLGAGKTAFTQGLGAALGIEDRITSPTFTLHSQYEGRLTLHHLDVYRLDQIDEVVDLGLAELLEGNTVTAIEWGDTILPALPSDYLEVRLEFADGDDDRIVTLRCIGVSWGTRRVRLADALAEWQATTGRVHPEGFGDGPC